jgi:hypothetical protein
MPSDFLLPLIDPTAPLPAYWPSGIWGAFLLFLVPIGGGIPLGVLIGRDAGATPLMLAGMYFVSDLVMAVTHEPIFWLLGWLAGVVPALGKVRDFFRKASSRTGLRDEGARGPLGLILVSFTVDPVSGRGAAAAAGHGFISGWTVAIIGDMMYFGVLMAATLWLSGLFGDDRTTVGVVLLAVWGLSWLIRRRSQPAGLARRPGQPSSGSSSGPSTGPSSTLEPALATVRADGGAGQGGGRAARVPAAAATHAITARPARKKAGRKRRSR